MVKYVFDTHIIIYGKEGKENEAATSNLTCDHHAYHRHDQQREKLISEEGIEGFQTLVMNFTLPISLFYTFYRASIKVDTVIFPITLFVVTAGESSLGNLYVN